MRTDPNSIAERLGVPPALIRRLQQRGYLRSFDLDPAEVRLRLWRCFLGQEREQARPEQTAAEPAGERARLEGGPEAGRRHSAA